MSRCKKICLVVGTRPEAIKLAPVFAALENSDHFAPFLLSTGQHREMLDQAFAAFGIAPDFDLRLMRTGQTLSEIASLVISGVADHLQKHKYDAIIVQGDTSTVLSASIAAFYNRIPIGHVEAGLRTHNLNSPWPEEMNRRLVSPIASWSFAPTAESRENLVREGIEESNIFVTGNTVIDALFHVRSFVRSDEYDPIRACERLNISPEFRNAFVLKDSRRFLLVTGHRRESFGDGFENICRALLRISEEFPDVGILYPVHLNPNVREPVNRLLGENSRIELVDPASYQDFVWLLDKCCFVLSDSGGVQEEAPSLGKPVLVLRENTERPEAVTAGTCRLVGTDPDLIVSEASILLSDSNAYSSRSGLSNPYGDGKASERIVAVLENSL